MTTTAAFGRGAIGPAAMLATVGLGCSLKYAPPRSFAPDPVPRIDRDHLVRLAPDWRARVEGSSLPLGSHEIRTPAAEGLAGFLRWEGAPLLRVWSEGRETLHPLGASALQDPVAWVAAPAGGGLSVKVVEDPGHAPWVESWNDQGAVLLVAARLDGSSSHVLLDLPASAGELSDFRLSHDLQGVALLTPIDPNGPRHLHVLGTAASRVIEIAHRPGRYTQSDEIHIRAGRAAVPFHFLDDDGRTESMVVFIDLATGDAVLQPVDGTRLLEETIFDGERVVTAAAPRVAASAGSRSLTPYAEPALAPRPTIASCEGGGWSTARIDDDADGYETLVLHQVGQRARPLWQRKTRTRAQVAWRPTLSWPEDFATCRDERVITASVMRDRWDRRQPSTILLTATELNAAPGVSGAARTLE